MSAGNTREQGPAVAALRINLLLDAIRDAHLRMASNRDEHYRGTQRARITEWLEEATTLLERIPGAWILIEVPR